MMPASMPMALCSDMATGDRQLVVQEAFETTKSSAVSVSLSFTP